MFRDPIQVPTLLRNNRCLPRIPSYFIRTSHKAFITHYFVSLLFIDMSDLNLQGIFLKTRIFFCFIFTSFAGFSGTLITVDILWQNRNCEAFSVSEPWIQTLTLLPASCMTLARVLNCPEPQVPHLKRENNSISFAGLLGELVIR